MTVRGIPGLVTVDLLFKLVVDLGLHPILQIERAHEYIFVLRMLDIWGVLRAIGFVTVNLVLARHVLLLIASLDARFACGLFVFLLIQESERARFSGLAMAKSYNYHF